MIKLYFFLTVIVLAFTLGATAICLNSIFGLNPALSILIATGLNAYLCVSALLMDVEMRNKS